MKQKLAKQSLNIEMFNERFNYSFSAFHLFLITYRQKLLFKLINKLFTLTSSSFYMIYFRLSLSLHYGA